MTEFPETLPPVRMSGDAVRTLSAAMRRWSGWPNASVNFTVPEGVPFASTLRSKREFHFNVDVLTRNPHRVLRKVTPFRMRQEAVLTGAMLHEAGHARHSRWRPVTPEQNTKFKHGFGSEHEGEEVNKPTHDLATLCEEARIEGLIYRNAGEVGALGLEWTMRVTAATINPLTTLAADPDQQIMDVITAYTLRAGRLIAAAHWRVDQTLVPPWVGDFQVLVHGAITEYLAGKGIDNPAGIASQVQRGLHQMYSCSDDTGTYMVDEARAVLDLLFPETDPDDCPSPSGGCGAVAAPLPNHPLDDEGEGEGEGEGAVSEPSDTGSALAKALAEVEGRADEQNKAQGAVEAAAAPPEKPPVEDSNGKGATNQAYAHSTEGTWRNPSPAERQIKAGAERFLRTLIDPTTTRKVRTTSQPSSSIDAAAYAAWKANGQRGEPTFFRQIKRTLTAAPPLKIAVLRDVSESMKDLTEPSALLSWSVAAAAFDLRNFAGRGVQIESCFVNWGSNARVVQHNGEMMRGIYDSPCDESTYAMRAAFELAEAEMPGFLDVPEVPTSRLIVHFTDWILGNTEGVDSQVAALFAGINTLSVVPRGTRLREAHEVRRRSVGAPGKFEVMVYDRNNPGAVWTHAAKMLETGE